MSPSELFKQSTREATQCSDIIPNYPKAQTPEMRYVAHYAISSATQARVLSRENAWDILEYLRTVGTSGSSAREISDVLSLPVSDVYSLLKDLCQLELTFALPKRMMPAGERRKRFVSETSVWNKYMIDNRFAKVLEADEEMKEWVASLSMPLASVATKIQDRMVGTYTTYTPCPRCGLNHEMAELLFAITLTALNSIVLNMAPSSEWTANAKPSWSQ